MLFPRSVNVPIVLSAVLCAFVLSGCGRSVKNDPVAGVDEVFSLIGRNHYKEAFKSTAFAFQAEQSEMAFESISRDLQLGNYSARAWTVKSVDKKTAELDGDFTKGDGTKGIVKATALFEDNRWRLYQFQIPVREESETGKPSYGDPFSRIGRAPTFGDVFYRKVPGDAELRALVNDTMKQFNNGLHKKSFNDFYLNISQLWQSESSRAKVERAFQPFIDADLTVDAIANEKAVFSEPARLNSEGFLLVKGYYPTTPNRVIFDLKYTFELPKWKLLAVTISIQP